MRADREYEELFRAAFDRPIDGPHIAMAVAAFVRSRLSGNSAFDRFSAGDAAALGPLAHAGRQLFFNRARCARCHSGALMTDEDFHNTGVNWGRDYGRFDVTGRPEDRGRFKTPSLRNVAITAPYMHDGSIPTLDAVVAFYVRGGRANPNLSPEIRPLHLSADDRHALVAFLRSLTSSR